MKTVVVNIKDEMISRSDAVEIIASDSQNFYFVQATFEDSWSGVNVLVFKNGEITRTQMYDGEPVAIPTEVLGAGLLYLGAYCLDVTGEPVHITAVPVRIYIRNTLGTPEVTDDDVTETMYDRLLQRVEALEQQPPGGRDSRLTAENGIPQRVVGTFPVLTCKASPKLSSTGLASSFGHLFISCDEFEGEEVDIVYSNAAQEIVSIFSGTRFFIFTDARVFIGTDNGWSYIIFEGGISAACPPPVFTNATVVANVDGSRVWRSLANNPDIVLQTPAMDQVFSGVFEPILPIAPPTITVLTDDGTPLVTRAKATGGVE